MPSLTFYSKTWTHFWLVCIFWCRYRAKSSSSQSKYSQFKDIQEGFNWTIKKEGMTRWADDWKKITKEVKSMTAMLIILKIMNVWKTSDHHVADDRGDHDEREGRGPSQVQATPLTENTVMIIIVVTNMTMMISTDREGRFYKNIWTHLNSPLKAFLLQCAASERSCLVFGKVQCPHCSKSNLQRREEGEKLPHTKFNIFQEKEFFSDGTPRIILSVSRLQ